MQSVTTCNIYFWKCLKYLLIHEPPFLFFGFQELFTRRGPFLGAKDCGDFFKLGPKPYQLGCRCFTDLGV